MDTQRPSDKCYLIYTWWQDCADPTILSRAECAMRRSSPLGTCTCTTTQFSIEGLDRIEASDSPRPGKCEGCRGLPPPDLTRRTFTFGHGPASSTAGRGASRQSQGPTALTPQRDAALGNRSGVGRERGMRNSMVFREGSPSNEPHETGHLGIFDQHRSTRRPVAETERLAPETSTSLSSTQRRAGTMNPRDMVLNSCTLPTASDSGGSSHSARRTRQESSWARAEAELREDTYWYSQDELRVLGTTEPDHSMPSNRGRGRGTGGTSRARTRGRGRGTGRSRGFRGRGQSAAIPDPSSAHPVPSIQGQLREHNDGEERNEHHDKHHKTSHHAGHRGDS